MHSDRFDRLAVIFGQRMPRRSVWGLLAACSLTGLVAQDATAQLGGLVNGQPCTSGDQCASGFCRRRQGTTKRFCRQAKGQGICITEDDACAGGSPACNAAGGDPCVCYVTTHGYSFCGSDGHDCVACETNVRCENRPNGHKGDRCVECASCTATNGRACVHTCPDRAAV